MMSITVCVFLLVAYTSAMYPNGGYPNGGYPNGGYPNGGYPNGNIGGGYPGTNGGYPGTNGGYPGTNNGMCYGQPCGSSTMNNRRCCAGYECKGLPGMMQMTCKPFATG